MLKLHLSHNRFLRNLWRHSPRPTPGNSPSPDHTPLCLWWKGQSDTVVPAAPRNPRVFVTHRRDLSTRDAALQRRTVISVQFRWTPVSSDHQVTSDGWYEIPVTINNHVSANRRVSGNVRSPSLTISNARRNDIFLFIVSKHVPFALASSLPSYGRRLDGNGISVLCRRRCCTNIESDASDPINYIEVQFKWPIAKPIAPCE